MFRERRKTTLPSMPPASPSRRLSRDRYIVTMAEAEEKESRSNEESTDESEEDDSEEEPKLKYERLSNGVTEVLQKDVASCMTVHEKFLALGTHYGKVYLLDVQGNITQKYDISPVKINQISLDESGEHMGVCSEDGKVQVFGLYTGEEFHETFDCPIKIVAVHPQFVRSHCKQFVTGGNKLPSLLGRNPILLVRRLEGRQPEPARESGFSVVGRI
ncbi:hypothetical protein JRQ81_018971, partial [Phrynocephalus forsythii]